PDVGDLDAFLVIPKPPMQLEKAQGQSKQQEQISQRAVHEAFGGMQPPHSFQQNGLAAVCPANGQDQRRNKKGNGLNAIGLFKTRNGGHSFGQQAEGEEDEREEDNRKQEEGKQGRSSLGGIGP